MFLCKFWCELKSDHNLGRHSTPRRYSGTHDKVIGAKILLAIDLTASPWPYKIIFSKVEGVEYLDTFVYTSQGKLQTKVSAKESTTFSYLLPTSCHPLHVCKNIPNGIAPRIYKISSEDSSYQNSRVEYVKHLCKRGYSEELVSQAFSELKRRIG